MGGMGLRVFNRKKKVQILFHGPKWLSKGGMGIG